MMVDRSDRLGESSSLSRHCLAGFGAIQTGLGACLAMVHGVLSTFVSAALANVSTEGTNCRRVFAAAGHGGGGKRTHFGAVNVIGNAFRHHLDVFFKQARNSAVVAGNGTAVTRGNARLMKLVRHSEDSFVNNVNFLLCAGQAQYPQCTIHHQTCRENQRSRFASLLVVTCAVMQNPSVAGF